MTLLCEIAHARAGDKGDTSILVVAPYDPEDFARVGEVLAVDMLAEHFAVAISQIVVRSIPRLSAYTVVLRGRLDGGVTRSRSADPHGKTFSGHILDLPLTCASNPTARLIDQPLQGTEQPDDRESAHE